MKQPDERESDPPLETVCKTEDEPLAAIPKIKREPGSNATFKAAHETAMYVPVELRLLNLINH